MKPAFLHKDLAITRPTKSMDWIIVESPISTMLPTFRSIKEARLLFAFFNDCAFGRFTTAHRVDVDTIAAVDWIAAVDVIVAKLVYGLFAVIVVTVVVVVVDIIRSAYATTPSSLLVVGKPFFVGRYNSPGPIFVTCRPTITIF